MATETMRHVTAHANDRLDTIARRAYPDIELAEGVRMLIWANLPGPLGSRQQSDSTYLRYLPLAFSGDERLAAPQYEPAMYGSRHQGLPALPDPPDGVSGVAYIDGDTGGEAPAEVDGLPYIAQLGFLRRTGTDIGRQYMDPDFGLDLAPLVDRGFGPEVTDAVETGIRTSLETLDGAAVSGFKVAIDERGAVSVQVILEAE